MFIYYIDLKMYCILLQQYTLNLEYYDIFICAYNNNIHTAIYIIIIMQLNPVDDIPIQDEGLELRQQVPQHNFDTYKNSVQYLKDSVSDLENISSEILDEQQKKINQPDLIQPHMDKQGNNFILKQKYYNFFKKNNIIPDPQNYIPQLQSDEEFNKHKIKYLKGNKFHQKLRSYNEPYIGVKNIQSQGTIVNYIVIIGMFELEITLLNFNQNANIQENKIGSGSFGSVRIQSQNKRLFAVKRQMFKNKYHLNEFNMMANKYQINQAITQLAIYKICSLLKIGPAAETQIGFDLICYRDCIEFHIQYCMKIEYNSKNDQKQGIFVDKSKFEKQIKLCLLTLHYYGIIHKDIKPANILFSIKYNKYVFTDFGISHPVLEKIGQLSITHLQGTWLYMSKQMKKIKQRQSGYVHLYGNDVHALSVSLKKQMMKQNIEQGMKQFNQKIIKQYNKKYDYEYLKLKYYCTKPDSKMEQVQNFWKCMNINRKQQLLMIVDKSIEYKKIKSVYNYLSKQQEFKDENLESLRIQSQSIKNIKIDPSIKQITELHLNNILRIYGYSLQVKKIIIKLKLQKKYKDILKKIDKIIDKNSEINHKDRMFGNHVNYIKKVMNQILECQKKKDYRGMFKKYMIILQYGDMEEQIETIQKLDILNYERNKKEKIEQMIRVLNIAKNKEKTKQFIQFMEQKDEYMDKSIISEKKLDGVVANIYETSCKYEKALEYSTKSLNIHISFQGQQHPSVAGSYNNIAHVYQQMGKYEIALQYYTKSVNMRISFYGQQHPSIADTCNNIASVYQQMGKYETALQYYNKSVNMQISFYGQQNHSFFESYNNIATLYTNMGKYETALQYYTKSLNMQIQFYGQQHPSVADIYNNIAAVYYIMGQYEKALQYYTKSLNMQIQFYGQQHTTVAETYNNIANVYNKMGKYKKALQYYTKSLNMQIQFYGQQHPSVADIYNNIAVVYDIIGQYEKALQYSTKSVDMKLLFHGQQHTTVADTYNNIANVYNKMGKYEKALQYYTKSVNMDISFYGQQHPSVAETYNNIANVYKNMGKYEKALQYYNKSANMKISFYGQQHPSVADTYNNIANVYDSTGKYEKALQYYTKSLNMQIQFYGQQHPSVAESYNNIATLYHNMGMYEKALQYYTKSINMDKSFYGQQHPSVAETHNNIANVYNKMGKYEKALQYYTKSINMHISFYGQQHPSVAETHNNIANVYNKIGKYEKALQYFTKSVNMQIQFYGQQHPSVAGAYHNISSTYFSLIQLNKSLKYCNKSIRILSNLSLMQYPQVSNNYHLLSSIFLKKKIYIKSLNYEYTALDTFVKTSHLHNYNSSYSFSRLADIYHEMNRFIQSYFFYRLQYQILIKHQHLHHINVQNTKDMMKKIKKSIPFLINNFKTNIQFINNINSKYKKLSKHDLLKLLLAKKWELRFEEQHRNRRDKYKYLKCVIQIYLCYKYLGYTRQLKKVEGLMKEELLELRQSQQKSMIGELIQVISGQ